MPTHKHCSIFKSPAIGPSEFIGAKITGQKAALQAAPSASSLHRALCVAGVVIQLGIAGEVAAMKKATA
jgi:hypothetical protein